MNEIETFLNKIKEYIDKKNDISEYEMSIWIEDFILDRGESISLYDSKIFEFINDRIVCEICEQTEPGLEGTNFRKELEEAYKIMYYMQ